MSINYNTKSVNSSNWLLQLDSTNPKSWSPNVFPSPLDVYSWASAGGGNQMTLSRDSTVTTPAGGIPLKIVTSGTSGYIGTYNSTPWNLASASIGQTWTVSFWIKGSSAVSASMLIFEANSSGAYLTYGQPSYNVTTDWTRVTGTYTFTNASAAYIQFRIDCYVNGVTLWIDGLQVERASAASNFNKRTNPNSSTWLDLSGNNNHATMYGTIPVSSDIVNYFDFTSVSGSGASSASLGFTFGSNMIPLVGSFAFSSWFKRTTTTAQDGLFSNSAAGEGFRYGVGSNGTYVLCGFPYAEGTIAHTSTYNTVAWHNSVVIFDRAGDRTGTPGVSAYLDGVYQGTMALSSPQVYTNAGRPGLIRSACCTLWSGKLSSFAAFSGYMSDADVLDLFNSKRGQYGL